MRTKMFTKSMNSSMACQAKSLSPRDAFSTMIWVSKITYLLSFRSSVGCPRRTRRSTEETNEKTGGYSSVTTSMTRTSLAVSRQVSMQACLALGGARPYKRVLRVQTDARVMRKSHATGRLCSRACAGELSSKNGRNIEKRGARQNNASVNTLPRKAISVLSVCLSSFSPAEDGETIV